MVAHSGHVCEWVAELVEQNLCKPGGHAAAFPLHPQPLVPEASDITTEGMGWGNSSHLMLSDCSTCIKYTKLFLTVVCLTCSWRPLMKNAILLQRNYPSAYMFLLFKNPPECLTYISLSTIYTLCSPPYLQTLQRTIYFLPLCIYAFWKLRFSYNLLLYKMNKASCFNVPLHRTLSRPLLV